MLKKAFRSVVSFAVVLCLLLGMSGNALAVLAADLNKDPDVNQDGKINYVSLGDSMSNGYGLPGYELNSGVETYGTVSYANQFEQWLEQETGAEVDHAQLAMSGIRAEDLHWLLELDYNDQEAIALIQTLIDGDWDEEKWNAKFTTGDYWTLEEICNHSRLDATYLAIVGGTNYDDSSKSFPGKLPADYEYPATYDKTANMSYGKNRAMKVALVAKYFQDHVADADIVSLAVGNGNLGVFGFGRILDVIGFDGDGVVGTGVYRIEAAIRELDPEMQAKVLKLKATLYDVVAAKAGMDINSNETLKALADIVVYIGLSMVLSYAGSIEAILQLNPDAEIIMVPIMNTFGEESEEIEGVTIGDLMETVVTPMNAFLAGLPTYMQAVENGVYKNAKFYYAEPAFIECMVEQYDVLINDPNSVTRDRFVEEIVGTYNAQKGEWSGMIWDLLKGVTLPGGLQLQKITRADVDAYCTMNDVEKATFAASNAGKAMSIAVYLAFEDAIIQAGGSTPVDLMAVMNLGSIMEDAGSLFDGILNDFMTNVGTNGAAYVETAYVVVAGIANQLQTQITVTPADVKTAYTQGEHAAAVAIVKGQMELTYGETLAGMGLTVEQLIAMGEANQLVGPYAALAPYYEGYLQQVATAEAMLVNYDLVGNVDLLCMLLAVPDTLSTSVQGNATVKGLLALFARCMIGNGLGAHPSANGHNALADAVIEAYANDFTAQDKTIQNLKLAAGLVADLVAEYYDDAYAYAYANSGEYIAAANTAIDAAIAKLAALDLSESEMTPAFKAEVAGEVEEIIEALTAAKALLNGADVLDQETLVLAVAALEEAGEAVANLEKLLAQAGADVTELVIVPAIEAAIEYVEEVAIPTAIEAVEKVVEEALNYLVEKLEELKTELVAELEKQAEALKAELEGLKAQLKNASAELKAEIESAIAEIEAAIAEIEKAGTEQKAELVAKLKAQVEKLLNDAVAELIAILTDVFNNATHTDYQINENSSYVAIGDNTAYAELLNAYLAEVAGNKYPAATLIQSATIAGAPAAIQSNLAAIAGADLISIGYGNDTFATQAIDAMMAALIEGEFAEYDWVALLGEDGAAYAAEAMAELYSKLVAMGLADVVIPTAKASLADAMMAAVESYIYNVAVYGLYLPEIIAAIQEINPDAQIIVVGMSNPFAGTVFTFEDMAINVGEYVQYVVDAANIYGVTYAVLTENVTFVPAPEAESAVSNQMIEMGLAFVVSYIKGEVTFATTEAGNAYIAEQIMNALTVTVETVGLLGDANSDGIVDSYDATLIAEYDVGLLGADGLDLSVCDVSGDGIVDSYDATLIAEYDVGLITVFPAEA